MQLMIPTPRWRFETALSVFTSHSLSIMEEVCLEYSAIMENFLIHRVLVHALLKNDDLAGHLQ
ncbi:MAG: hypothetical protein CV087_15155 [Candidatus Brocadia sp. WS118]|nr:MAG: hypothetical protein CV087_15155 [Candidatus Brocadia sp. WS118]